MAMAAMLMILRFTRAFQVVWTHRLLTNAQRKSNV